MMAFRTIFVLFLGALAMQENVADNNFNTYYSPQWGRDHLSIDPRGTQVQLKMDRSSGAGFRSKLDYASGMFHIRMKIPDKKTEGIVTAFYLISINTPQNHFEVDYEFLGTNGTLQTNVFANDTGYREQKFKLWFDPTKDFHTYEILWNSHQIVFFVDQIPIRVFKNNMAHGINYVNKPMHVEASIWNAPWAGRVEWSNAPFIAHYQDFGFGACPAQNGDVSKCASQQYFWNRQNYLELNARQKQQMENYRRKYMIYDYCSQSSTRKKECSLKV